MWRWHVGVVHGSSGKTHSGGDELLCAGVMLQST